jgi:hypothetical protein
MALNEDGLEAGKPVDFQTFIRVKREQAKRLRNENSTTEQSPVLPRPRREKPKPRGNGQSSDYAISRLADKLPTAPKEEKKS